VRTVAGASRSADWIAGAASSSRCHDLRRTWATRAADLGAHPWVIGRISTTSPGVVSGVSAIYNRYSYLKEARTAVRLVEEHFSNKLAHHLKRCVNTDEQRRILKAISTLI